MNRILTQLALPFLLALPFCGLAQLDFQLNLTSFASRNPRASIEFPLSEKLGFEAEVGTAFGNYAGNDFDEDIYGYSLRRSGILLNAAAKFYFNPEESIDGFYVAPYARYRNITLKYRDLDGVFFFDDERLKINRLAVGANAGYKYVFDERFIIEALLGVGVAVLNRNDVLDVIFEDEVFGGIRRVDLNGRLSLGFRLGR